MGRKRAYRQHSQFVLPLETRLNPPRTPEVLSMVFPVPSMLHHLSESLLATSQNLALQPLHDKPQRPPQPPYPNPGFNLSSAVKGHRSGVLKSSADFRGKNKYSSWL